LQRYAEVLRVIGCDVDEKSFTIDPPSWRSDLLTPADFTEEVARMIGYDKIPCCSSSTSITCDYDIQPQKRRRAVATMLASRGLVEVQTFPFTNQATIDSMGFVGERANIQGCKPMSEEFPLMRVHLVPGLIEVAQRNISRGAGGLPQSSRWDRSSVVHRS
jgi:phenylalanyl-tRNA synthetase beta chain